MINQNNPKIDDFFTTTFTALDRENFKSVAIMNTFNQELKTKEMPSAGNKEQIAKNQAQEAELVNKFSILLNVIDSELEGLNPREKEDTLSNMLLQALNQVGHIEGPEFAQIQGSLTVMLCKSFMKAPDENHYKNLGGTDFLKILIEALSGMHAVEKRLQEADSAPKVKAM